MSGWRQVWESKSGIYFVFRRVRFALTFKRSFRQVGLSASSLFLLPVLQFSCILLSRDRLAKVNMDSVVKVFNVEIFLILFYYFYLHLCISRVRVYFLQIFVLLRVPCPWGAESYRGSGYVVGHTGFPVRDSLRRSWQSGSCNYVSWQCWQFPEWPKTRL